MKKMELKEYQNKAKRTNPSLGSKLLDEQHMAMGMVTEAGEFIDVYKKYLAYGKPIDYVNLKEELGDLMWYIANFCILNNWELSDVLDINIKKLEARFPNKFTEEAALNRDLNKERAILEGNDTK